MHAVRGQQGSVALQSISSWWEADLVTVRTSLSPRVFSSLLSATLSNWQCYQCAVYVNTSNSLENLGHFLAGMRQGAVWRHAEPQMCAAFMCQKPGRNPHTPLLSASWIKWTCLQWWWNPQRNTGSEGVLESGVACLLLAPVLLSTEDTLFIKNTILQSSGNTLRHVILTQARINTRKQCKHVAGITHWI